MHANRIAGVPVVLVLASTALIAADTKPVTSHDGACRVTVPSNWTTGSLAGIAESPDKKLAIVVSSPKMVDSFAELKQTVRSMYANSKVTKNSATEFEMEGQSMTQKPDVYRAIPIAGNRFCIAEITYETGTVDVPRSIIQSLKSAK